MNAGGPLPGGHNPASRWLYAIERRMAAMISMSPMCFLQIAVHF